MATQQMIHASISSSSSSLVSLKKYDVFLSFRGEDTRKNFTSHLYDALIRKKVETFMDDNELQKGDDISPSLIKAIEESDISIVIFSQDYASSKWCLNELIKILQCKNDMGQIVIPVFYNIDPSHIRKQTESYQRAFAKHEQDMKLNKDMLQKWKAALSVSANLVGFDSSKYRNESDVIKVIVEDVFQKLKHRNQFKFQDKKLVRIEEKCEEIESLLKIWSNDVRILGLWGMGGVGKTTIAKALYAKLCSQYDGYCLLLNVREETKKHGLNVVRHRLFSALLEEENLRFDAPDTETHSIMRRLSRKKLLIVLDDVADSEQLEYLVIDTNCLGVGSRVIVTTRDKQIIRHVHEIYEVRKLNESDSLELFCLNAFKKNHPKIGYEELSKSAIAYCKGNPLALKVLGTRLGLRSKMTWKNDLKKLQEILDVKIHNVLKLSYDDLDDTEKDIFLDIACFFVGERRYWVTSLLDACGFFATVGMEVLHEKALITTSSHGVIEMHDLIREMGRAIVNKESMKNPGERSRLWKAEEVIDVLKNNTGTEAIEGIQLDSSELVADISLSHDSFKRMTKLRYLAIDDRSGKCIYFPDGLGWLSNKIRYLRWDAFLLNSLPLTYFAEMLVELHMENSKLNKLWTGVQDARHLKKIDLSFSEDLIEMPDLSRATNLERVNLRYCKSLQKLHPSVLSLPKLQELNLEGCNKIKSLKSNTHSKSLRVLNLNTTLEEFSVTSEKMKSLSLSGTAIRELPSSFWGNSKLELIHIERCYKLNIIGKRLSNDHPRIRSVTTLNLRWCKQIDALNLSHLLDGIQSLKRLYLRGCYNLETLPQNIHRHSNLNYLELDDCIELVLSCETEKQLPQYLRGLNVVNCTLMDTDTTQRLLFENSILKIKNGTLQDELTNKFGYYTYLFIPGDHEHVLGTFDYQNGNGASITIPPIPKSNLKAFMFCILLSEGVWVGKDFELICVMYEDGKKVGGTGIYPDTRYVELNSDHVLLCLFDCDIGESGSDDYYNLSFELNYCDLEDEEWSTEGIKGCGVTPIYAMERVLELDDKSSSLGVLDSNSKFCTLESHHVHRPYVPTTTYLCSK